VPQFVAPSSYLRFKPSHGSAMAGAPEPTSSPSPPSPLDKEQQQGLVWPLHCPLQQCLVARGWPSMLAPCALRYTRPD
jgi:hypothetical protein